MLYRVKMANVTLAHEDKTNPWPSSGYYFLEEILLPLPQMQASGYWLFFFTEHWTLEIH